MILGVGQHEDRRARETVPELDHNLAPARVGQHEVGDHNVGTDVERRGLGEGCRLGDDVKSRLFLEERAYAFTHDQLVVHE